MMNDQLIQVKEIKWNTQKKKASYMTDDDMQELRNTIVNNIEEHLKEHDWDAAFIKFFGGY
jgi:hypothetical protein